MIERQQRPSFGKTDVLLILMALIWGVNFSVVKYATQVFTPLAFTGVRVGLAAVVLISIVALRNRKWPARRDILALIALGVVGNGIYQLMFVEGLSRTKVGNASLIVASAPAFIAVASRLGGIERLRRKALGGVALSVSGVALVVLGSARAGRGQSTLLGTTLVFCGMLLWTAFTVLLQPYARRLDPVHLSAFTMLGGTLPLVLATPRALIATSWSQIGIAAWAAIFYASVISMVVAYLFWYRGLRVLGPTRTAVYGNLQPIIAITVAWIFLHEAPTLWQGIGTGTIMTGLFLTRS
ncbi:MAG: DMT family transporter [Gemmatimonadaceae bacterium]|nr:DMT family transporter [Gemmatimonadaceae bacterium]MDQ3243061.1 DMT family transporter [Gemmatimonadota bacterium]